MQPFNSSSPAIHQPSTIIAASLDDKRPSGFCLRLPASLGLSTREPFLLSNLYYLLFSTITPVASKLVASMACIKHSVRSGSSSVLLPFLVVFLYATLLSHHFLSASAAVAAAHGRHSRRNHASTQSRASTASGPGWYRNRAAVPFQPATRSSSRAASAGGPGWYRSASVPASTQSLSRFAAAAASGPCSFVSCPKGCTCAASGGVAKCSCKDPCYGVKCPHVSKCALQGGAVVCKCPAPFKRLINNRCSSDDYPNSDYLDPHNAARAAVGAVPLEWDDAVAERAQAWADTLRDDYNCGLEHGGMGEGEGQNLSGAGPAGWASNNDAVQWWVGEGKWYKRPPAVFPAGCIGGDWGRCGHYTQVIWNNSRQVGCGKASCGEDGDVWACNYYPAGNFVGEIPYVQDPCFRALCPSTSTCAAVNGKPVCLCPRGQVLVNGSKCQADPCKGAAPCPGDFVCDGTSGAAKCVCPKGTVQIAPNTCQAPSCKGVKCPASARCRADSNGIPFCACPASQSLVNGACTKAGPRTVTTSIVLFSRPSFAGTPIVLRGPTPDTDDATGCVNIPSPMAGTVGSLKILWDAPDGAKGTRVACGLMWFWSDADCYGDASGWDRPDNNVTIAKATDDGAAVVRAISCGS